MILAQSTGDPTAGIVLLLFLLGCIGIYLLPTLIAAMRGHPNAVPIAVVNILLGWTLIGYVVALAWSFTAIDRRRN